MKANLQRKATIIRDAYCFQLPEFLNDNSLGTKIDFEFTSENSPFLINDLEHLSKISLFICSAQTFPRIFWMIICLVRICRYDSFLMSLHIVSFTANLYLLHVYSITALTSSEKSFVLVIRYTCNPARHEPLTQPLSELCTGTTRPKTLQLFHSLSYSTGNALKPTFTWQAEGKTNNIHPGRVQYVF